MSDLDHDLYGDLDLDLEDLDATQLDEELVDPDNEQQQPVAANAAGPSAAAAAPGGGAALPPIPMAGFSGEAGAGDQGLVDRIRPSDMPDEGKMFVGGLNWETTDDGLRAYFSQFGEIDACTIMRDATGRSRGFAFLTFTDPASVQRVMDKDHQLDGKMIDPKRAIPRAEHERTAKVFVGGLAPSVTSESLKEFLGQYGKVMDATVMFDRANGRSKGFAFATFADEQGVDNAMANSGVELEGKQIEIKKAQPRGAGTQVKTFTAPGGAMRTGGGMGGFNAGPSGQMATNSAGNGSFDPNAMAMMYQNMMKGPNMGMMGGFDPNAMAMMYQNMMKNMGMNAPAINPSMAGMMNRGMGMGMGGMNMGMGNMGMMNMGMGMGGMNMGMNNMGSMMRMPARPAPNAPRGPAAMRSNGPSGMAQPMAQGSSGTNSGSATPGNGSGPQRYSTQGSQRARPY